MMFRQVGKRIEFEFAQQSFQTLFRLFKIHIVPESIIAANIQPRLRGVQFPGVQIENDVDSSPIEPPV